MLVLSRKKDESIVINGNIHVKVLSIQGNKVRLGIDAPADLSVHRAEVLLDITAGNGPQCPGSTDVTDSSSQAECSLA